MNSKKMFFVIMGILVILGGLLIASVVVGNQMLQKKSKQLVDLKVENRTLEEQQLSLIRAKKDINEYSDLERTAKVIVPQEKDQARTVREIINIANSAGVNVASVSFPTSTLGQPQAKPPTSGEGGTPAPAPTVPPITQVKPVENIKGVYKLEMVIQSDTSNPVPYTKLIDFLTRLEQNRRTAQVTSINVQPSAKGRNLVTFSVTINVYIKP